MPVCFKMACLPFLLSVVLFDAAAEEELTGRLGETTQALLCADQADNRILLIDGSALGDRNSTLWSFPDNDEEPVQDKPTDAKRVEVKGVIHVLAAYHGRVRLIRFKDHKVIRDFPTYSSCHSAEVLPDNTIVTANSNHGILRHHLSDTEFLDIKLPYAHGVTWDRKRKCLWALGDMLYLFSYKNGALGVQKKFPLPGSPTGHDLFPLCNEDKLLVSNNVALYLFDPLKEEFDLVSELAEIKSASQKHDGSIWITDPAPLEGGAPWQTDSVTQIRPPQAGVRVKNKGSKFYKARWWQKVDFSY